MNRKIRILHISKRYPPYVGGIETVCHDICSCLKETGEYEQKVIAFNDKPKTIEDNYEGIDVIRVGVQRIIASQPLAKDYGKVIKKVILKFKPDIIHFQYPDPFAAHYVLKYMKRFNYTGKFLLQWNCDIIKQKILMKFFDKQNKDLIKKADIIATITPTYTKDTSYLPFYKKDYELLSCRVGDARLKTTEQQKDKAIQIKKEHPNKTICFFFGRHVEYKGLKYLIESDQYLDQNKIDIIIAGSGPLTNELKQEAKKYKNISFVGRLSDNDINSYLMACDIFTFPSITRNEAFGISLAEAMYFGKPSVTFTIKGSGVNWVSINGETGLEAENKNVKQYASLITSLSTNKTLYNKLATNSKERCDRLFTIKAFNENVINIYNNLIGDIKND